MTTALAPRFKDRDVVEAFFKANYRVVTWPANGDSKGPREEGWPEKKYTLEDYREGYRVGIMTGTEISQGKVIHDYDNDWAQGWPIALAMLPPTEFMFGRDTKKYSHFFYTAPAALPSFRWEDIDKTILLEFRGTKADGTIGMMTMVPPSMWSKDGKQEFVSFIKAGTPGFYEEKILVYAGTLTATGEILAKHLGHNGFGHDARMAWAGFLLRLDVDVEDLVRMGEAMSIVCNNREMDDVRRVVESTKARLESDKQKIKGGPALAKIIGKDGRKVIQRILEWFGKDDFQRDKNGNIKNDNQNNIRRALDLLSVQITRDEFAERMLIKNADGPTLHLEDAQVDDLYFQIDSEFKFRPSEHFFQKFISALARENSFHPIKDYLGRLNWDGTPRLRNWLVKYGGAIDLDRQQRPDDEQPTYVETVSELLFLSAVKRIQMPGCKYDEMIVIEGDQGTLKSSALRDICPRDEWFGDDFRLNINSKELMENTQGKWIVEVSDLSGRRHSDIETLKALMSRRVDGPARMAYARRAVERARCFILVGTTNLAVYLVDPTGLRRFWPVKVNKFDVDGLRSVRDQLWAEAVSRIDQGASIRMPERLWEDAKRHQEARQEIDPWETTIEDFLRNVAPSTGGFRRVTADTLFSILGIEVVRRDRTASSRISQIMQRLKFTRTKVHDPETQKTVSGYREDSPSALPLADHVDEEVLS